MTQAQKLQKLIERAIENGWKPPTRDESGREVRIDPRFINWETTLPDHAYWFIFNKDFARALFRGGPTGTTVLEHVGSDYEETTWGYEYEAQLQVAVISDNPIGYYYNEVFGKDK